MSSSAPSEGQLTGSREGLPENLGSSLLSNTAHGFWRLVTRPFRVQTWRDTAYLLLGGITSVLAFGILLAGGVGGGILAITLLGLPVLVLTLLAARGIAWAERRRAWLAFGSPIVARYRTSEGNLWAKTKAVLGDLQTWKDLLWLVLIVPIGFGFALGTAIAWGVVLGSLLLPAFWWAIPESETLDYGIVEVDSWTNAIVVSLVAFGAAILLAWIVRGLALAEALLARVLLTRNPSPDLAERVTELEETRAAAVDAQGAELRRIERDLHDGAQARLIALALDLGLAREKFDPEPEEAKALVESAHETAKSALQDLRELVRGIHPAILADRGLRAALPAVAANSRVPVQLEVNLDRRLPEAVETAAYFVVLEALVNVSKHSEAAACIVVVDLQEGRLVIQVTDNGQGGADPTLGSGLSGLAGRVGALDGTLEINSPPGGPTILRAEIPCES